MKNLLFFYFLLFTKITNAQDFPSEIPISLSDTSFFQLYLKGFNYIDSLKSSTGWINNPIDSLDDGDNNIEKKFEHWSNQMRARLGSHGNTHQYKSAIINLNNGVASFKDNFQTNNFANDIKWIPIGPAKDPENACGPSIGLISAILSINTSTFLVSTGTNEFGSGGGIFKTINGAQNWYNTTDMNGLSIFNYGTFTKDPINDNLIFAGILGNGNGLIYSNDKGETWKKSGFFSIFPQSSGINNWSDDLLAVKIFVSPINYGNGNKKVIFITAKNIFTSSSLGIDSAFVKLTSPYENNLDAEVVNNLTQNTQRYIIISENHLMYSNANASAFSALNFTNLTNFPVNITKNNRSFTFWKAKYANIEVSGDSVFIYILGDYIDSVNNKITERILLESSNGGITFLNRTIPAIIDAFNMRQLFKVSPNNPNRWYMESGGAGGGCNDIERKIYVSNDKGQTFTIFGTLDGTHVDQRTLEFITPR